MTRPPESPERRAATAPGRLDKMLRHLLMKRATVVATERVADRFRLITLEGPALKGAAWTPGRKIQIAIGSAFVARTYTPIEWDCAAGRTCILGYEHGGGPGSAWIRDVESGDHCDIFGPRASLELNRMTGPLAVFGDETSLGLACALARQDRIPSCAYHFEVGDPGSIQPVVAELEIGEAVLFTKREDNAHLAEMAALLPALTDAGASFVLTGKASTIQRIRQCLTQQAVPAARIVTKAYWATGKTGLD